MFLLSIIGCTKYSEYEYSVSYPTLRVSFLVQSDAPKDLELVEETLNLETEELIGVHVDLIPVRIGDFSSIYMQLASEENPLDLMLLLDGASFLSVYVNNRMIIPIDDYMTEYGHNLSAGLGKRLEATQYRGQQYAIPQIANQMGVYRKGFHLSARLCDAYGIDPNRIHSVNELEKAFDLIHREEPDINILMPDNSQSYIAYSLFPYYDPLTVGPGVLIAKDDDIAVKDLGENTEFKDAIQKVHEWYEKGYIPRDVNTTDQQGHDLLCMGQCFATASADIGPEMGGVDYYSVVLTEDIPIMTTNNDDMLIWCVSSSCEYPEKAVEFLNLCYRNSYISNLLHYGIVNVHYTIRDNGTLDIKEDTGYSAMFQFGNIKDQCFTVESFQAAQKAANIIIPNQLRLMYNDWDKWYSPAYGFFFDDAKVSLEVNACREVNRQYLKPLLNGVVDPDTELLQYTRELENAGMNKVIEEKQRQLKAYLR